MLSHDRPEDGHAPISSTPVISPDAAAPLRSPGAHNPKTWSVGTLTYTAGGLAFLFFWLLWGDFAWALKERALGPAMQIMLKKYEAVDWFAGLLLGALPPAVAMILCPIVAYHSDRHRGRWGRRIPFLLIPAPIISLGIMGIAFSPMLGGHLHNALGVHSPGIMQCTLLLFALSWTLYDFANVTANGLFVALINDVVPSQLLGRFFGAFRILSLVAGMAFNYWLLGKVEAHFLVIFLAISILFGGGMICMCLNVKEGQYPPPPPPAARAERSGFSGATANYFRECFGKSYYMLAFVVLSVPSIAFVPVNLFNIFFAKSIHMDMDLLGKWTAAMFFVSTLVSYPLGMLADRFHPLRLGMVMLVTYAAIVLWGGLFIHDAATFTAAYFASGILAGAWATATASLPQRLFPKEKFAEYLSALGIVNCLSQILIGPLLGFFLDATGHIYRYSYLASFVLASLCMGVAVVLHRRFVALGGPKGYVAP